MTTYFRILKEIVKKNKKQTASCFLIMFAMSILQVLIPLAMKGMIAEIETSLSWKTFAVSICIYTCMWLGYNAINVKWYKHIPSFGYNFKQHYNSNNELRYSYMVTERPLNGQYDMCHTNIMNDKMEIIDEDIRMLKHGTVKNQYPLECHTFTFLDDKHYIMTAVNTVKVKNIPGYENKYYYVINNIIQEQKDGEVVWHFETIDYPELYTASCKNNSFEDGTTDIGAADYAHINAISKDKNGDILVSFRNIGMVKINYKTKEIMWIMGRNRNDIVGLNIKDIPYLQHDVRYLTDGSFTIFDNCGSSMSLLD